MFNSATPTGWTRFSDLDDKFPRGYATYAGTGGDTMHNHTATTGYTTDQPSSVATSPGLDFGTGADGDCIMNNGTKTIDTTAPATVCVGSSRTSTHYYGITTTLSTTVSAGATSVTVASATGFATGDEIMIINMQGVSGNSANVGQYDTAYISSVSSNTLNLDRQLTYGYATTNKIMIQRIPNFSSVTVCGGNTGSGCTAAATLNATAWNATTYKGVLPMRVSGTLTIKSGGTISMSGRGYIGATGGAVWNTTRPNAGESTFTSTGGRGGFASTTAANRNGEAGIRGGGGGGATKTTYAHGTGGSGVATNGAGGGGGGGQGGSRSEDSAVAGDGYGGGGGGGSYGTGAEGGSTNGVTGSGSSSGAGGAGTNSTHNYAGGGGGGKTYGIANLNSLFLGSSGGASGGGRTNSGGTITAGRAGANGGGIIYLSANTLTMEATGSIVANGNVGQSAAAAYSGCGGSGSGGSIKLEVNSATLQTTRITATAGVRSTTTCSRYGGAGGDGRIAVRYVVSISGSTSPTYNSTQISVMASGTHTHDSNNATSYSNFHTPPYRNMVFAKANADIYATSSNIVTFSALPPLGWSRFTSLDDKIVRAASTHGGTGGAVNHAHAVDIYTGAPSATSLVSGSGTNFASSTHTHSCTNTSSGAGSNFPPYIKVIFGSRKVSQNIILGDEEMDNYAPLAPTSLLCNDLVNPTQVTTSSPYFSAFFSDPDLTDTGNYYQIQINTSSSFGSGTMKWDSSKTAFGTPITNDTQSSDITYTGTTLVWGTKYYWRIRFWDQLNSTGAWSSAAEFTMNYRPTTPTSLKTEDVTDNGKATVEPYFSAIFEDLNEDDTGNYYQIVVNTQSDFLGDEVWDSEKTAFSSPIENGLRTEDIDYDGDTLDEGTIYYWRIRIWDNYDADSYWSNPSFFLTTGAPFAPTELLTNGIENPTLTSKFPRFTAIHTDPNEDSAAYYQIQVNSSPFFSGTELWDSGKQSTSIVHEERSPEYRYAGTPLLSSQDTFYWRIRFWDTDDKVGEWSEAASFVDNYSNLLLEGLKLEGLTIR
jgi:hypothetical protein